jgi:hypothetical protein
MKTDSPTTRPEPSPSASAPSDAEIYRRLTLAELDALLADEEEPQPEPGDFWFEDA